MLVLSRKPEESVKITIPAGIPAGTEILVKVLKLERGLVKIGFKGVPQIKIMREEVSTDEGKEKARQAFMQRNKIDPAEWEKYLASKKP